MPLYVVLEHDSPDGVHFDFMLQVGQVLRTWALPQPPIAGAEMVGRVLPDHRLKYLEYEGPVSGNRGSVVRHDGGDYRLLQEGKSEIIVQLSGEKFTGRVMLKRLGEESDQWQFTFLEPETTAK
jgi:hypothetical protein